MKLSFKLKAKFLKAQTQKCMYDDRIKFWFILRQKEKGSYLTAKDMNMQIKNFKFKPKLPLFQYLVPPVL